MTLLAAGLLAAHAGCEGCADHERPGPKAGGPVQAEFLVFEESWLKISRSARDVHGFLRIEGKERIEHRTRCHAPERLLAAADDGRRFAYRCDRSAPWFVVHANAHGHAWEVCDPLGGTGETPDWSAVPTIDDARADLLRCHPRDADDLLNDALADAPATLGALLASTARTPLGSPTRGPAPRSGEDPWLRARERSDDAARKAADDALRAAVAEKGAGGTALKRAFALFAGELPPDLVAARVSEIGAQTRWSHDDDRALASGIRALLAVRPAEAGTLACAALSHGAATENDAVDLSLDHLAFAVAASKTSCPALAAKVDCGSEYDCGEGASAALCTREQLEALVATDLATAPLEAAQRPTEIGRFRSAMLVGRRSGGLPAGFDLRNQRRRYRVVDAPGYCWFAQRGAPCLPFGEGENTAPFLCAIDLDAKTADKDHAIVAIDDAAKTLSARHVCNDAVMCSREADCCEGHTCDANRCRPSASASSAAPAPSATAPR